jgi:hypothetical protein
VNPDDLGATPTKGLNGFREFRVRSADAAHQRSLTAAPREQSELACTRTSPIECGWRFSSAVASPDRNVRSLLPASPEQPSAFAAAAERGEGEKTITVRLGKPEPPLNV